MKFVNKSTSAPALLVKKSSKCKAKELLLIIYNNLKYGK